MLNRAQQAQRVTWIGFFINLVLSLVKLVSGIVGNSAAMVADAVHSISDFVTDIIVIVFVRIAGKGSDHDHRYGHGKFETFATLLIGITLLVVGIGIFRSGLLKIIQSFSGQVIESPTSIALIAAAFSIILKEWLFRYTIKIGKRINNQAVIANGWHHRSDAFSSLGTLLGIGGAMLLGGQWRILDPLAGVIVSFFIVKVAIELGLPSVKELLEAALPHETENEIIEIVHNTPGVKDSHRLKTRKIGNAYAIDIHVQLNRSISFVESHDIATNIENNLRERFGQQTQINIHTEPL
jgi:cation diffusion facilitator family transporter